MSPSNSSNIGTWVGVGVGAVGSGAGIVGAVGAVYNIRNTKQQNDQRDLELGEIRVTLNLLEGETSHNIGHENPTGLDSSINNNVHQDHGVTAPQEAHLKGEPPRFKATSRLQKRNQQPDLSQPGPSQPEPSQPEPLQTVLSQPEPSQTVFSQPESSQSESSQSEPSKPKSYQQKDPTPESLEKDTSGEMETSGLRRRHRGGEAQKGYWRPATGSAGAPGG